MKYIKFLIVILGTSLLTACVTTQNFSSENKNVIHKITIDQDVKLPTDMTYVGPGIGFVGLLSLPSSMSTADQIKNVATKNNIKIGNIVRDQFINDIKSDTHLAIIDQGKADANLKIEVFSYGFIVPQGFSLEVSPMLVVRAKLMRGETIVWQNQYQVTGGFYTMKSYKTDDLINHPQHIASAWHDAAEKAVKALTKELA